MEVVAIPPPRIRILPSTLADQIAAGEVVERPASVVKELAENAVDAGATKVDVEIEAGGRRLIRIIDDGHGMTPDEARLALQRHATSKITSADDLWGLHTFGFRGEALPSIAAVARLTLRTKTRDGQCGFHLLVEGGREAEAREVGMADGTQIEVRDLFFNTPARLKFLKSEATEAANISEAVLRLALAHPEVHFRLRGNGRVALDLPRQREMGERVRAALARRGAGALHEAAGEEGGHRVRAFLAAPEEAATTPRSTFLFVGRRFVRDRSLLHALALGYGELLEKGRYPLAALFLDVPGDELDVNVHPQKLEVRFSRAQEVYAAVRHVVAAAVAKAPWRSDRMTAVRAYSLPPPSFSRPPGAPSHAPEGTPSHAAGDAPSHAAEGERRSWGRSPPVEPTLSFPERPRTGAETRSRNPVAGVHDATASGSPLPQSGRGQGEGPAFFAALDYIGQLDRTYLICQSPGELVLVDQHAAHERVAYQRLRVAHRARSIARQRLLFPIPIELDELAAAAARAPEMQPVLESLGFDVEPFGPATLLLRAVPELLADVDPKPLLLDLLHRIGDGERGELADEALDQVFATMACHSVVRAGDILGREKATALLAQLDEVDLRSHCPHGRPVLLRLPIAEIERRFGRT